MARTVKLRGGPHDGELMAVWNTRYLEVERVAEQRMHLAPAEDLPATMDVERGFYRPPHGFVIHDLQGREVWEFQGWESVEGRLHG